VSAHEPPRLNAEPLKLLFFDFNEAPDPDPAFHSNEDPNLPASKNNVELCGSGSATLPKKLRTVFGNRTGTSIYKLVTQSLACTVLYL
jgi:hypothetical protein